jgi:hypothetical protein
MADGRAFESARLVGAAMALIIVLAGCAASSVATPAPPASTPAVSAQAATPQPSATDVAATVQPAVSDSPIMADASPSPSAPDATPAAAVDPCALLTLVEARALVGGIKAGAGGPEGDPPTRCVWPTPTSGSVGQVEIDVGDGAFKTLGVERTLGHDLKAVPALGDEAWLEPDTVFFRVGATWVAIHLVMLNDPAANDAPLLKAAALVASRL